MMALVFCTHNSNISHLQRRILMAAHFRRLDLGSKELEQGWLGLIGPIVIMQLHLVLMNPCISRTSVSVCSNSILIRALIPTDLEICLLRAPALLQSMIELAANAYATFHQTAHQIRHIILIMLCLFCCSQVVLPHRLAYC